MELFGTITWYLYNLRESWKSLIAGLVGSDSGDECGEDVWFKQVRAVTRPGADIPSVIGTQEQSYYETIWISILKKMFSNIIWGK